jgi:hypothetical protein
VELVLEQLECTGVSEGDAAAVVGVAKPPASACAPKPGAGSIGLFLEDVLLVLLLFLLFNGSSAVDGGIAPDCSETDESASMVLECQTELFTLDEIYFSKRQNVSVEEYFLTRNTS